MQMVGGRRRLIQPTIPAVAAGPTRDEPPPWHGAVVALWTNELMMKGMMMVVVVLGAQRGLF